ncbi:MAG: serine/threonine protein kinase [Terriglobales bacterium]
MTDNWDQFKELFQSALELPQEQRAAYLDRVCGESSSRAELEALLVCYQDAPDGRQKSVENLNISQTPHSDPLVESFMDHYQIIEKVSQKGPATQYLALRLNDPNLKQVIVTVLKTTTSAAEFLRSFKRERLILMNLRHPNIAAFFDTGITRDGLAYLAAEHIDGIPIDEYCDAGKLNTHGRINLFMDACGAVQYAHHRFIAHVGINAKNILITKSGIPKMLDLGIAALLNQEFRAQTGLAVAMKRSELEYISPEQIRGELNNTSDDVYSLGVLLYQLLTGHSPYWMKDGTKDDFLPAIFEATKPSKVLDQIVEETAPDGKKITINAHYVSSCRSEEIRAIRRRLSGDLDSIVLKAIQKDSSKRYATVEQFTRDIRLYLEGKPVSARENTFLYRAGKFFTGRKISV